MNSPRWYFILAFPGYGIKPPFTCGLGGPHWCTTVYKSHANNAKNLFWVRFCFGLFWHGKSWNELGSCKENCTPWHFTVRTLPKSDRFRMRKLQNDNISPASILKFSRSKTIGFWQSSHSEMSRGVVFFTWFMNSMSVWSPSQTGEYRLFSANLTIKAAGMSPNNC